MKIQIFIPTFLIFPTASYDNLCLIHCSYYFNGKCWQVVVEDYICIFIIFVFLEVSDCLLFFICLVVYIPTQVFPSEQSMQVNIFPNSQAYQYSGILILRHINTKAYQWLFSPVLCEASSSLTGRCHPQSCHSFILGMVPTALLSKSYSFQGFFG